LNNNQTGPTHTAFTSTNGKGFMQTLIHRDSKPWQVQVWVSFLIAVFLCAVGCRIRRAGAWTRLSW
jgi:hypothetical protein